MLSSEGKEAPILYSGKYTSTRAPCAQGDICRDIFNNTEKIVKRRKEHSLYCPVEETKLRNCIIYVVDEYTLSQIKAKEHFVLMWKLH